MRKNLWFALALVTPFLATAPAIALPTGTKLQLQVEGANSGSWTLRKRVVDTGTACRYTVMWSDNSGPPLTRTTLCKIDESKASDNFDCEVNRTVNFDTLVQRTGTCKGFDDFGQESDITTLIAGESSNGLDGIYVSASVGDVQSFHVS